VPKQFSAQAQNQALGYLYQVRYALLILLRNGFEDPEAQISIEYLDDIAALEKDGDPKELIQMKHHVKKASLSDSSSDIWRTLRVWSENLLQGRMQLDDLTLTLITTEHASDNSIASKLRPFDSNTRNIDTALDTLNSIAQSSTNQANLAAYKAFLCLSDEQQKMLLSKIQILDDAPDIIEVHKEITNVLRYTTRPKFLDAVRDRLEGWWFSTVVQHLSKKSIDEGENTSLVIPHRDLQIMLNNIQEQFLDDNLPIDYSDQIIVDEDAAKKDCRIFVKQLNLIEVNILRIQKAISDFYRASEQRSRWIRDDILLVSELDQYEAKLCDEWERLFAMMQEDIDSDLTDINLIKEGRKLFNSIQYANIPIRSRCTEAYIMRGSFHMLADNLYVGWHADFRNRLKTFTV
jgi:hypothetical protein